MGPKLFTIYSSQISDICHSHSLNVHVYADDTQLYLWFDLPPEGNEYSAKERIQLCVSDILKWCKINKLKINEEKTEFIVLSTPQQRKKVHSSSITIGHTNVEAVEEVRDLGALFDQHLHMDKQVSNMCRSAYAQLRNISKIRSVLSRGTTETLVHALVLSRLDNGNALLCNISCEFLTRLQRVQNTAARCIMGIRKRDSVSRALITLHWLPVKERIQFKVLLLTWKALHSEAPTYIQDMLTPKKHTRQLRSTSDLLLEVPRTNLKTYGDRAFAVYAPKLWNALPSFLKECETKDSFKTALKTYLFHLSLIHI